jgi:hypothetical protein
LNDEQPVALQLNKRFILFQSTGVLLEDYKVANHIPPETWALSDSHANYKYPCDAFLTAITLGTAWVIQTTFPSERNWKRWKKEYSAVMCWMDVLSLDEMMALGKV